MAYVECTVNIKLSEPGNCGIIRVNTSPCQWRKSKKWRSKCGDGKQKYLLVGWRGKNCARSLASFIPSIVSHQWSLVSCLLSLVSRQLFTLTLYLPPLPPLNPSPLETPLAGGGGGIRLTPQDDEGWRLTGRTGGRGFCLRIPSWKQVLTDKYVWCCTVVSLYDVPEKGQRVTKTRQTQRWRMTRC